MKFLRESEEHFHFETTSKLGNSYGIGFPKEGGHTRESIERALAKIIADTSYKPIDYHWKDLKWDPNTGADYTSSDANDIGIQTGGVDIITPAIVYNYQLWFKNTKGWTFAFQDGTGDIYACGTFLNGYHTVEYNSSIPVILACASY